jgi:hypothetical protein
MNMSEDKVKIYCGFEDAMVLDENGKPKPIGDGTIEISKEEREKREKEREERLEAIETCKKLVEKYKIDCWDIDIDCDE